MDITLEQLVAISPYTKSRASVFLPYLNAAMKEFDINTPLRQAAFLAQIIHESCSFRYTEEIASGKAYNGRLDLGNMQQGDGERFKGRALIQVTGRTNYVKVMMALGIDCLLHPELLSLPENACRASAWWWSDHKLNGLADLGTQDAYRKITKIINGGTIGWEDRLAFYNKAREVLEC